MHRLVVLLATAAFTTSIFAGDTDEDRINDAREKMCIDRNTSVDLDGCGPGRYFATMYIYNETNRTCHELPESICIRGPENGVFFDVFTCAITCTGGKGPESCFLGPHQPANNETCEVKERMWYDSTNSCEPNRAWFYNASSEQCEEYRTCRNPQKFPEGVNGFFHKFFCNKYCGRFNINNKNGSKNRSDRVNCTAEPLVRCSPGEESKGEPRYFYNASVQQCQMYYACENNWPKGLKASNYFVTNRSCELECGNCVESQHENEVAARDDLNDD
uniref:Putative secreted protein n=1 Tax=Amblyomma cajennense TaxID=34607 RepID=A0A023FUI7_AMBCJ